MNKPKKNYFEAPAEVAGALRLAIQAAIDDGRLTPEWRTTANGKPLAVCTVGVKLGELTLDPATGRGTDHGYVVSHLTVLNPLPPGERNAQPTSRIATVTAERDRLAAELAAAKQQLQALLAKQAK